MKLKKYAVFVGGAFLLFSFSAFAKAKDHVMVSLDSPTYVGSTLVKPGQYKVEWRGTPNNEQVSFLDGSTVVATTHGKMEAQAKASPYTDVDTTPAKDDHRAVHEIDFQNQKQALILAQGEMLQGQGN